MPENNQDIYHHKNYRQFFEELGPIKMKTCDSSTTKKKDLSLEGNSSTDSSSMSSEDKVNKQWVNLKLHT